MKYSNCDVSNYVCKYNKKLAIENVLKNLDNRNEFQYIKHHPSGGKAVPSSKERCSSTNVLSVNIAVILGGYLET